MPEQNEYIEEMATLKELRQYWYNLKYRNDRDRFKGVGEYGDAAPAIGLRIREDGGYEKALSEYERRILWTAGADLLCYARDLSWTPTDQEIADALEHFIDIMQKRDREL